MVIVTYWVKSFEAVLEGQLNWSQLVQNTQTFPHLEGNYEYLSEFTMRPYVTLRITYSFMNIMYNK